jgi:hypothetical protein
MYHFRNPFGYDESVLQSDDDFEPYGFDSPRLAESAWNREEDPLEPGYHRVIEGAVLAGLE